MVRVRDGNGGWIVSHVCCADDQRMPAACGATAKPAIAAPVPATTSSAEPSAPIPTTTSSTEPSAAPYQPHPVVSAAAEPAAAVAEPDAAVAEPAASS